MVKYGSIGDNIIIEMAFTAYNIEKFTYNYFQTRGISNIKISIIEQLLEKDVSINENLEECNKQHGGNNDNIFFDIDSDSFYEDFKYINRLFQSKYYSVELKTGGKTSSGNIIQDIFSFFVISNNKTNNLNKDDKFNSSNIPLISEKDRYRYKIRIHIENIEKEFYIKTQENTLPPSNSYKAYKIYLEEQLKNKIMKQRICNPLLIKCKKNPYLEVIVGEVVSEIEDKKIELLNKYKGTEIYKIVQEINER